MPRYGEWIRMPDGTAGHVSYSGPRRRPKCRHCRRRADYECDFPDPSRESGTCDAPLCKFCAVFFPRDRHECRAHHPEELSEC